MDKSWLTTPRWSVEYGEGVKRFIDMARANARKDINVISCPCRVCKNLRSQTYDTVVEHLVIKGMDATYTTWVLHGESMIESCEPEGIYMSDTRRMCTNSFVRDNNGFDHNNERLEPEAKPDSEFTCFKAKSAKYREIRSHQEYVHRTSRRKFARLEHDLRQAADDPSLVRRVDVWREGHSPQDSKQRKKKDKNPINPKVAEIMSNIEKYQQTPAGQSQMGLDDDPLTHVFGCERAGRIRGMGFGVTSSQVQATVRSSKGQTVLQREIMDLRKQMAHMSAALVAAGLYNAPRSTTTTPSTAGSATTIPSTATPSMCRNEDVPQPSSDRVPDPPQGIEKSMCDLLHYGRNPYVVARGQIASTDAAAVVHHMPLGRGFYKVWIHQAVVRECPLLRPTAEHQTIGDAEHSTTAWPINCIQFN